MTREHEKVHPREHEKVHTRARLGPAGTDAKSLWLFVKLSLRNAR